MGEGVKSTKLNYDSFIDVCKFEFYCKFIINTYLLYLFLWLELIFVRAVKSDFVYHYSQQLLK